MKIYRYSKDFSPNNWDGVCSDFISDTLLKSNIEEYKKEPLALEYNEATVYSTGAIFITLLVIVAFRIGTDSFNFLLGSCI